MTVANERKFLLWFIGILLSILSFIGALGVQSNLKLINTVNDMKTIISTHVATDKLEKDAIKYRVELLEQKKK